MAVMDGASVTKAPRLKPVRKARLCPISGLYGHGHILIFRAEPLSLRSPVPLAKGARWARKREIVRGPSVRAV